MRTIKFRGLKYDGQWVYGLPTYLTDYASDFDEPNGILGKDNDDVDPKTIGEFTGLQDSQGTDIYEGDIVEVPDDYDKYGWAAGSRYKVIFLDGGFRASSESDKGRGYWLEDSEDYTVIGNIHQNPELWK